MSPPGEPGVFISGRFGQTGAGFCAFFPTHEDGAMIQAPSRVTAWKSPAIFCTVLNLHECFVDFAVFERLNL